MTSLRKQIPWLALAAGVFVTLGTYFFLLALERDAIRAEFNRRSQTLAGVIEASLHSHEATLYSLRNLFQYSEHVTRDEFAGAADDLIRLYIGIQALEWVERVPGTSRAAVEAAVQNEGFPDFQFTRRAGPNQLVRVDDRPEHFPVLFVHPLEPNRVALGFDLTTGTTWPEMQRAARNNTLVTSGRLRLITDGRRSDWGYLLELPVYHLPVPTTPDARMEQLRGFVLGVFRLEEIIEGSIGSLTPQGVDLLVLDPTVTGEGRFLHFHASRTNRKSIPPVHEDDFRRAPFHQTITLPLSGRQWKILTRPAADWLATQHSPQPVAVLAAGLFSSILLCIYLRGTLRRTELIAQEVTSRTAELRRTQEELQEDIRQRRQTELALQASEARMQAIIDYSPALIWVKDLEGRYLLANRAFRSLLLPAGEWPEGRTDSDLFPIEFARNFRDKDQQVIATGQPQQFEEPVPTATGERIVCLTQKFLLRDTAGRPYGVCGLATNISASKASEKERLALQQQLLEAKKLEALGVLAGGIAHDFNNILTTILGNASLTSSLLGAEHPQQSQVAQIQQAARRAADLCAQMLAYAGKGNFVVAPTDLSRLVRDTAALLKVSLRKDTQLGLDMADSLPAVMADSTQLRQIVMNLVLNAADAIGARADGTITLTTFVREMPAASFRAAVQSPELPAGRYVGLAVSDNGSGISPETLARIFEPFFTTKFSGRGLGLAAVLGIVQSHHGALFVESVVGQGTTFRLLLPALANPAPDTPAPIASADRSSMSGTVLLVDDEHDVRLITERVLRRFGLTALIAASGDEALALCREHGPAINLLLLDLTMPGLSGEETLRQIRQLGLPAQVVVMSGYSESEVMARCADLGAVGFLHKPFDLDQLIGVLRRHLG